jgi:hypothetical protein
MTPRVRATFAVVLSISIALIACSLPGNLLRRAASTAIDSLEATTEALGPTGGDSGLPGGLPGLPGDLFGSSSPSVVYDVYVGANVTGHCGPTTNSGSFASLSFDSTIQGVRFYAPSESGLPGPLGGIALEAGESIPIVGMGLLGEGQIGSFTFCPMYEGDEAHPCTVTEGPNAFEPSLSLSPESGIPDVPLVGTPVPSGGGEAVLIYSIGAAADLSPILVWDCEMGTGALGGSLSPGGIAFSTSWDRLMMGEGFSLDGIAGDEGETWEWTLRLVPRE